MLDPREDIGDGYRHAYGFFSYPDGRYGHGGGDPGVACLVHRFPDDDADLVVLCNVQGWADELRKPCCGRGARLPPSPPAPAR